MWIEAGFSPGLFHEQTPRHFQLAMKGVRGRLEREAEDRLSMAWHTAAFTGATQSKGGLKPLARYLKKPPRKMGHAEMLANMRILAERANRKAG